MSSENYENYNDSDSIFEDSSNNNNMTNSLSFNELKEIEVKDNSIISNFFDSVSSKLNEKKAKKLQNEAEKILKDSIYFFQLLNDFGCTFIYNKDSIDISCEQINLKGKIRITKNKELEFDEKTKEILTYIANVINRSNSLHDIISKYEDEGFYPIGELRKETAIINGAKCEVLIGTMENDKKEQKTIYYYNGNELFLGENQT